MQSQAITGLYPGSWRKSLLTKSSTVSSLSFCSGQSLAFSASSCISSVRTSMMLMPFLSVEMLVTLPFTQRPAPLLPLRSCAPLTGTQTCAPTWYAAVDADCVPTFAKDISASSSSVLLTLRLRTDWCQPTGAHNCRQHVRNFCRLPSVHGCRNNCDRATLAQIHKLEAIAATAIATGRSGTSTRCEQRCFHRGPDQVSLMFHPVTDHERWASHLPRSPATWQAMAKNTACKSLIRLPQ